MLVLTEAAAEAVKALTSTPQAPEGSGLRIASSGAASESPGELQVSAAPGPGENDQVIDAAGARVYLEPQAAAYLDDKVLDAQIDNEGQAHFSLGMQGPGPAQQVRAPRPVLEKDFNDSERAVVSLPERCRSMLGLEALTRLDRPATGARLTASVRPPLRPSSADRCLAARS